VGVTLKFLLDPVGVTEPVLTSGFGLGPQRLDVLRDNLPQHGTLGSAALIAHMG